MLGHPVGPEPVVVSLNSGAVTGFSLRYLVRTARVGTEAPARHPGPVCHVVGEGPAGQGGHGEDRVHLAAEEESPDENSMCAHSHALPE